MKLVGGIVNGGVTGGRIFDAAVVVQSVEHNKIIERAAGSAIFNARLQPVPQAAEGGGPAEFVLEFFLAHGCVCFTAEEKR